MATDPEPPPMERWPRGLIRAVALAYRRAMAEGGLDPRLHPEWFWRPVRARIEREDRTK